MKKLLLSTAFAGAFVLPSLATADTVTPFQSEASAGAVTGSDLIGARVYVSEAAIEGDAFDGVQDGWDDIGEVNELIISRDGSVDAVLVDIGGFLGLGEHRVAVDMGALKFVQDSATDADDWFLVLHSDRATLDKAPLWNGFDLSSAENAVEEMVDDTAKAVNAVGFAAEDGFETLKGEDLRSASLAGARVHHPEDGDIGEVVEIVTTEAEGLTGAVIDVGGFMGIGEHRVAVPMSALKVVQKNDGPVTVLVSMTEDELEALPAYVN